MRGAVVAGRFRIERRAGAGGMGTVYRAIDLTDGRPVALKILGSVEARDAERFAQEADVLARLEHPAIVRYIAHGLNGDERFIAMEWLDGNDLAQRLERGPLSPSEALRLARRTAEGLAHAHSRGIVHRDIKPQNLFLAGGQHEAVKILDFGIAWLGRETRRFTRTGTVVGTPGYLAPELIDRSAPVDGRADLFSLGCVLFEALTGRPPFMSEETGVLLAKIVVEEPPPLRELAPEVPRPVDDLVRALLAKEPDKRLDAEAVIAAIDRLAAGAVRAVPPRKRSTMGLTAREQRIVCVVMAGAPAGRAKTPVAGASAADPAREPETDVSTAVLMPNRPSPTAALQVEISTAFGARVHSLPDGRLVLTVPEGGTATDQAARAARCALAVRRHFPDLAVAVATGSGRFSTRGASGPVVDAVVRLLRVTDRGQVRVDATVASLVEGSFELHRGPAGPARAGPALLRGPRARDLGAGRDARRRDQRRRRERRGGHRGSGARQITPPARVRGLGGQAAAARDDAVCVRRIDGGRRAVRAARAGAAPPRRAARR